jgi:PiT family inorganic phosphate transporter
MTLALLFAATLFLAYSNGANDNFKGVATLYGSRSASYRRALTIATLATLAGALASAVLAHGLVQAFSGRGLVPDALAASADFVLAVGVGAGATVILATLLGFPISTTHGLTGALLGAGWIAAGDALNAGRLGMLFFLPLLVSPVLAVLLTMPLYKLLHSGVPRLGITRQSCVCLGEARFVPLSQLASATPAGAVAVAAGGLQLSVGTAPHCVDKYSGAVLGFPAQRLLDFAHVASASLVCFARGLNDTPKIVALMLVIPAVDARYGMLTVAAAMLLGGLLNARKVARTMSFRVSRMNDGQAFTANFVTGLLVAVAGTLGLPVSTTHVAVGAISGIGVANRSVDKSMLGQIVFSWLLTLPVAALIAGGVYTSLRFFN